MGYWLATCGIKPPPHPSSPSQTEKVESPAYLALPFHRAHVRTCIGESYRTGKAHTGGSFGDEPLTDDPSAAVWAYWEDGPRGRRSVYLDLCLETIKRHVAPLELRLLSRDDAVTWLPDLDVERWSELPAPNYRSDYVRSRVLQRHGGIWIDIDTVVLSPLSELLDQLDGAGMACWGQELGRCFTNLCAASPGAAFVDAWVRKQDEVLDRSRRWSDLGYSALAQDVSWGLARNLPWKSMPMDRVAPVPWYQWRRFLSRTESPGRLMAPRPVTFVLWNALMAMPLRRYDRDHLLASRILLARLLRIGLGLSEPTDEEDAWTRLHELSALRFSNFGQRVEATARRLAPGRAGGTASAGW